MKKPFMYLLTAGLAISMITTGTTYAEEKPTQFHPSKATVTFEAPTGNVNPLDPDVPASPLNQDTHDGESTGFGGPLSLDYVSNLSFGDVDNPLEITSETMNYESISLKPFVQVSDFRGTGAGWRLTAQASNFTSDYEIGDTLIGSSISLIDGSFISPDVAEPPVFNNETINLDEETAVEGIKLETGSGAVTPVATASAKVEGAAQSTAPGQGTWLMRWFEVEENPDSNVILNVIGNTASPGTHTSTITWTLENGPTGPVEIAGTVD